MAGFVEVRKGQYVDVERIDTLNTTGHEISFSLAAQEGAGYVDRAYEEEFLGALQRLNQNRAYCTVKRPQQ